MLNVNLKKQQIAQKMVEHAGRSHKRGKPAADGYGTDYVQR